MAHRLHPGQEHEISVTAEHVLGEQDQVLQGFVVIPADQPVTENQRLVVHQDKGTFTSCYRYYIQSSLVSTLVPPKYDIV